MSHVMDAFAIYAVTALGGRHVFPPSFDSTTLLQTIERERVSCTSMASHVVSGANDPCPPFRTHDLCVGSQGHACASRWRVRSLAWRVG